MRPGSKSFWMSCSIIPAKATNSAQRFRFAGSTTPPTIASPEDKRRYLDFTGCGNTLNFDHPRVLQMVMDSLRYWVEVMHVDGFRFDLAVSLARESTISHQAPRSFARIAQDPVLCESEADRRAWDLGADGYQLGSFRRAGANGMTGFATRCGDFGAATADFWPTSLRG